VATTPKKKRSARRPSQHRARARAKHPKKEPTEAGAATETHVPAEQTSPPAVAEPELEPIPAPIIEDMQTPLLGVPPSRRSAYFRLVTLAFSFFLAVYLGLEAASIFVNFNVTLPISHLLMVYGHLPPDAAAYTLLGILVVEVVLVQIWAWRTRRLSGLAFEEEGPALETPKVEEVQPTVVPAEAAPAEQPPVAASQAQAARFEDQPVVDSVPPTQEEASPSVVPESPQQAEGTTFTTATFEAAPSPEPPRLEEPEPIPSPREIEVPTRRTEEQTVVVSQVKQEAPVVEKAPELPKAAPPPRPVVTQLVAQPKAPRVEFLESYTIYPNNPDVYVGIQRDPETGGYRYLVVEPRMNPTERQVYSNLTRLLVDELEVDMAKLKSSKGSQAYLVKEAKTIADKYSLKIPPESYRKIAYYFTRDYIKLGKIEVFMNDPKIEDISCDGPRVPLFIWHRDYESIPTNVMFADEKELDTFAAKLAYVSGKHISIASPIVDATLPDGSRIQITYGKEVSKRGGNFTIRKFKADPITIVDLLKYNTVSPELGAYMWYLIERRMSILVAGGTASGKTTTLNALSMFIPPDQKIVSVEDTPELNLSHKNWIQSISRGGGVAGEITLFDLLRNALRQRPDIIIVGEVRGAEAFTLFQAIATGHGGLGTVHADSVQAAVNRLTTEPMNVPKSLLGSTLDCVAMQLRIKLKDKSVRRMVNVAEIVGHEMSTDQIVLNNAFKWDPVTDTYIFSGRSRLFEKITKRYGVTLEQIRADIENRRIFLTYLMRKNVRDYRELSQHIRDFYSDQQGSMDTARKSLEGTIER